MMNWNQVNEDSMQLIKRKEKGRKASGSRS